MSVDEGVEGEQGAEDVAMSDGGAVERRGSRNESGRRIVDTSAADPFVLLRLTDSSFMLLGPKGQVVTTAQRCADSGGGSGSEEYENDNQLALTPVTSPLQSTDPVSCFTLFSCPQTKNVGKGDHPLPSHTVFCAAARTSGAVQIFHVPSFSLLFTTHGILQDQPLLALSRKVPSLTASSSDSGPISSLAVCCYAPSRRLHLFAMLPGGQVKCYRSFTTTGEAPGDVLSGIAAQAQSGTGGAGSSREGSPDGQPQGSADRRSDAVRYHLSLHALEGARKLRFEHLVLDELKGWQAGEEEEEGGAAEGREAAAAAGAAGGGGGGGDGDVAAKESESPVLEGDGKTSRPSFVTFSGLGAEQMGGVGRPSEGGGRGSSGGDHKESEGAEGSGGSAREGEGEGELSVKGLSGVFVTGRRPRWFVLQRDAVQLHGMVSRLPFRMTVIHFKAP